MQLNCIKEWVIDPESKYVELQSLNGVLQTVVFQKISEPNLFEAVDTFEGDAFDAVIARYSQNESETRTDTGDAQCEKSRIEDVGPVD